MGLVSVPKPSSSSAGYMGGDWRLEVTDIRKREVSRVNWSARKLLRIRDWKEPIRLVNERRG